MNITKSPFSLSFSSPACPHRFLLYPSFSSRLVPSASSVCSSLSALQATPCRETDESVREIERYIMHTKKKKTQQPRSPTCHSGSTSCFLCSASLRTSSLNGALFGTPMSFLIFRLIPLFFASFLTFL